MSDFESIRDIARRLVQDYRVKRAVDPIAYAAVAIPADVQAGIEILDEPRFDGIDRQFLWDCGIEA